MGNFRTDMSQWPIIVHKSDGVMGPEETQVLIDQLNAVLARKQRYISIFESSNLSNYKMGDRDRIVSWMKTNDAKLRMYCIGTGVVLSSAALRFAIAAVMLIYKPASPIKVFSTYNSALAWARSQVQTDALRAPAQTATV